MATASNYFIGSMSPISGRVEVDSYLIGKVGMCFYIDKISPEEFSPGD